MDPLFCGAPEGTRQIIWGRFASHQKPVKKRRKIDEKRNFCTSTEKKKRMTQINRNFEQQTQVNFNILYSKILNKAPVTEKARKFEWYSMGSS